MDELNKAEIEELDAAIDKYKNVDTKTLSELSHDSAWYEAWDKNHNAVMTSLNIAKAGDASNEKRTFCCLKICFFQEKSLFLL